MGTNTGIGIGNGIPFWNMASGRGKPYLSPEVKEALKAVVIAYGKTNNDSDRAVVKNLVDPDNPFVISNAAYTEGSGYTDKGSPYYGAFVTDGVNDLINSTKTVQEMLGGSNEITVVSMMANLDSRQILCNSNYNNTNGYNVRNTLEPNGVISMLGYTDKNGTTNNLNLIMGDKDSIKLVDEVNFNSDYVFYPAQYYGSYYKAAWYWTVIANKVLTTDQINQVIAYFNLDRTLKPDILCNTIKQGITNENHAEFSDKLIDFSGNGRDIQLNNIAWKGGSGIAAKPFETVKDYTIIPDKDRQELTIYNEFSYKVKSNTPNRYWAVQSIIKDNTSYQVTIITDKDCYWVNSTTFTNSEGNKDSIRKEYPVKANTPTQVTICGLNEFEYPEGIEPSPAVSFVNLSYAGEITVTFIPSYKGGLLLDGVNDFGQFVGDLGLKDYTLIMNRAYNNLINNQVPLISSNIVEDQTPFIVEHWNTGSNAISFSYGASRTTNIPLDINKKIVYQSTYSYMGYVIPKGNAISTGNGITLGKFGNGVQYSAICLWSLMLFPYSMSEFLIERQLKKHKLGTLYPNMVEFRPVIKANANYNIFYTALLPLTGFVWEKINIGDYIPVGRRVAIQLSFDNEASELVSAISSQLGNISITKNSNNKGYTIFGDILKNKSPQKINITIDEYIRYEDIKQPYPLLFEFTDENGNLISWGGKAKVGNTITRTKSVSNANILAGLYNTNNYKLNGKPLEGNSYVVEKQMVFTCTATWTFDNNEPKCILSPRLLRIPNSSYKILGYIPDISGHGNNGVINNSAYAEGSGVNEDGSYQFDGVDDFVAIPTTVGGKQVLMKVNWQKSPALLYDQRASGSFAVLTTKEDDAVNSRIAYQARNHNGRTYIDGIENNNIETYTLKDITHNITIANSSSGGVIVPVIGCNTGKTSDFAQMSLYDFMLFDEISTDDKIKELNEYVGIEAKVEKPPYYWDAYGKTNSDADRDTISQRGVAVGDYDLTNYNHAYDKMSGYGGYKFAKFDNTAEWFAEDSSMVVNRNGYLITLKKVPNVAFWKFRNTTLKSLDNPLTFKVKCNKPIDVIFQVKYAKNNDVSIGYNYNIKEVTLVPNESTTIIVPSVSVSDIPEATSILFINVLFDNTSLSDNEEYTVEMLPLYSNGLVYDGIEDYSVNTNIPALTDYTYIIKRENLNNNVNSATMYKGNKAGGGAFIVDYIASNGSQQYSYGNPTLLPLNENTIIYGTKTSYNGSALTVGSNTDENGLDIGHWSSNYKSIVLYKLILYPKTIPLLQINFLKNLMEKDEIIDLTNPIFIKNE